MLHRLRELMIHILRRRPFFLFNLFLSLIRISSIFFLKVPKSGGEPAIFFIFIHFLSQFQCLRPLGYCTPTPPSLLVLCTTIIKCLLSCATSCKKHKLCNKKNLRLSEYNVIWHHLSRMNVLAVRRSKCEKQRQLIFLFK